MSSTSTEKKVSKWEKWDNRSERSGLSSRAGQYFSESLSFANYLGGI